MVRPLPPSFYGRDDVVQVSRELLGKVLCTRLNGVATKAVITETEAYAGVGDKASHAYGGRRTRRTEPMYFERVVRGYPESEAAGAARERLEEIEN